MTFSRPDGKLKSVESFVQRKSEKEKAKNLSTMALLAHKSEVKRPLKRFYGLDFVTYTMINHVLFIGWGNRLLQRVKRFNFYYRISCGVKTV
jgi:hypothetical protein